jgi:subfamily B ATP-binding cassette protein MsbA
MTNKEILVRLYKDYTSKFLRRILIAGIFSILVAGSTSSIAYLLDPAIKKIFVEKDQTLIYLIPIFHLLYYQIYNFNSKDPKSCFKIFKSNNFLGLLVFVNLLIGKVLI